MRKINNLTEKIFGKLTIIQKTNNPGTRKNDTAAYWKCLCSCGKICTIRGYSLTTNKTKSCGCLKLNQSHLKKFQDPKYSAKESVERLVWQGRYRKEISFEDFYKKSQMNCSYCGISPSIYKISKQKTSKKEIFSYNLLDRIDSSKGHENENTTPCCLICNRAKLNRSLNDFLLYKKNLLKVKISFEEHRNLSLKIANKNITAPIKIIFKQSYNDGNLLLEQFYKLSQLNCYYCNAIPNNKMNYCSKYIEKFIYNGLDRIDSSLPHNYENLVACCKYCNFAKERLRLEEFNDWIIRAINHNPPSAKSFSKSSISLSTPDFGDSAGDFLDSSCSAEAAS